MKIGTLECKLFGHRFVQHRYVIDSSARNLFDGNYLNVPINFCDRCGIKKTDTINSKRYITVPDNILTSGCGVINLAQYQ